jgi:hypothetical protein
MARRSNKSAAKILSQTNVSLVDRNEYTYTMEIDYSKVCYSRGCKNYATIALKIPLGPTIQCIIHVCNGCLSKYKPDANDRIHYQHQIALIDYDGSDAAKI